MNVLARVLVSTFVGCALAVALLVVGGGDAPPAAIASHASGADAIAIDMDPDATPANTATSLGTREDCAQIIVNAVQDADEDSIDAVLIDVTIENVPASAPTFAYGFSLNYDESEIDLQAAQTDLFLGANAGSSMFVVNDALPDTDGNDLWRAAEVDTSDTTYEYGSGVLQRLTVGVEPGAATALYDLVPSNTATIDDSGTPNEVDAYVSGWLAIDVPCPQPQFDYDGDGVWDIDEAKCGGVHYDATKRPERIDGIFAGVDDNGDTVVDEALPAGSAGFDCDGDGYIGSTEDHVYSYVPQVTGDQKTCQEFDTAFPDPNQTSTPSLRWPVDLWGNGTSANKVNVQDITSFLAPVYYLNTNVGTNVGDVRWDIVPGNSGLGTDINIVDLVNVQIVAPAMLGQTAFNGPPCPYAP